jgi:hypothetical protein
MKTASFNAFTSSPMAMQHPLAKNQKALGQSQREGFSILIPLSPSEVAAKNSLNYSALKPIDLKNILRVPPEEGNTFTDAAKNDSSYNRRILNSTEASKLSLRNLSYVLNPYGLDIGIVINPDRLVRPRFTALITPKQMKGERSRLVIPVLGIKDPSQVGTKFTLAKDAATSIIDEVIRVFSEKELEIIKKGLIKQRDPLNALISGLSK